jgi:hypothetical protein
MPDDDFVQHILEQPFGTRSWLQRPRPERQKIWPADNKVGNVRNTGAELVLPLETLI